MLTVRHATASMLADTLKKTVILQGRSLEQLKKDIQDMQDSGEHFGEVDPANGQQVELLAYRILKGNLKTKPKKRVRFANHYRLAIIGAGPATAFFLDTQGVSEDAADTVVIGDENPWVNERGHAIAYINHTLRQTSLPSANETRYGGNETFVNRKKYGEMIESTIVELSKKRVKALVTKLSRQRSGVWEIACNNNETYTADRVVFMAGSGEPRRPPETKLSSQVSGKARIIEMNVFLRDVATSMKGRVAIWGANAAIDAVAAAKKHGWEVEMWLYSQSLPPAWLPGTRYKSPPYCLDKLPQYAYKDRNLVKIEDDSQNKLKLSADGNLLASDLDYVVYGLGTEDLFARLTRDSNLTTEDKELEPILDTEGVFQDPSSSKQTPQAFLGWTNRSGDLRIFGLAAENYENKTKRIDSLKDDRVSALKRWLSGDVLTVGQLTYIRSAIRAFNHFIPGSIEHRVDFSHADANMLRVHLAAKYPSLPEVYAQHFIGMISEVRTDKSSVLPHGFTQQQVEYIENALRTKEQEARKVLESPEQAAVSAFRWRFKISVGLRALLPDSGQEVESALKKLDLQER